MYNTRYARLRVGGGVSRVAQFNNLAGRIKRVRFVLDECVELKLSGVDRVLLFSDFFRLYERLSVKVDSGYFPYSLAGGVLVEIEDYIGDRFENFIFLNQKKFPDDVLVSLRERGFVRSCLEVPGGGGVVLGGK